MIGLRPGGALTFALVLTLYNRAVTCVSIVVGVVAPSNAVANAAGSLYALFNLLFAGFLTALGELPPLWQNVSRVFPARYAYEALIVNELYRNDAQFYISATIGDDGAPTGPFTGVEMLSCFEFYPDRYESDVIALGVCVAVAFAMSFWLMGRSSGVGRE